MVSQLPSFRDYRHHDHARLLIIYISTHRLSHGELGRPKTNLERPSQISLYQEQSIWLELMLTFQAAQTQLPRLWVPLGAGFMPQTLSPVCHSDCGGPYGVVACINRRGETQWSITNTHGHPLLHDRRVCFDPASTVPYCFPPTYPPIVNFGR